tara:strand:- start:181 stop:378 length:198 start_codon:yes stop_codon:yes gene_type:complete
MNKGNSYKNQKYHVYYIVDDKIKKNSFTDEAEARKKYRSLELEDAKMLYYKNRAVLEEGGDEQIT